MGGEDMQISTEYRWDGFVLQGVQQINGFLYSQLGPDSFLMSIYWLGLQ